MRTLALACALLSAGVLFAEEKRNNNFMATKRNNLLVADAPLAAAPSPKKAAATCNCSAQCQCAGKSGGVCNCKTVTAPSRSRRG